MSKIEKRYDLIIGTNDKNKEIDVLKAVLKLEKYGRKKLGLSVHILRKKFDPMNKSELELMQKELEKMEHILEKTKN